MSDTQVTNLRKADFWTSLVLLAVAAGMMLNALSMPLEGTYAGVQNAWYVSPALFPIIVATCLLVLSGFLLANAIRSGGARAALHGFRRIRAIRAEGGLDDFWIVGGILAVYIYIFIPRVDFIAATVLLLFTLVATYDLASVRAARRALALFGSAGAAVLLSDLLGFEPAPRSTDAYVRDVLVWVAVFLSIGMVSYSVRAEPESRARLARCIWISILTPLILGTVFKYGLLVPLPNEGVTVEVMDSIRYGLPGLLSN